MVQKSKPDTGNLISENLRGFEIKFMTAPGVFSRRGLDGGTRLLIDHLEVKDSTQIADLGCGTGAIGFVCSLLNPHGHVHLLDDHLRSVELAKKNAELNNFPNVEVYLSDLFSAVEERSYHQIMCNPPQSMGNEFLEELIRECALHLKPGASLWIVIKKNIRSVIERYLEKSALKYQILAQGREHVVIKAIKF